MFTIRTTIRTYLRIANTCYTVDQTGNSVFDVGISEMDPAMENKPSYEKNSYEYLIQNN